MFQEPSGEDVSAWSYWLLQSFTSGRPA